MSKKTEKTKIAHQQAKPIQRKLLFGYIDSRARNKEIQNNNILLGGWIEKKGTYYENTFVYCSPDCGKVLIFTAPYQTGHWGHYLWAGEVMMDQFDESLYRMGLSEDAIRFVKGIFDKYRKKISRTKK